jgi:hypothetical protein
MRMNIDKSGCDEKTGRIDLIFRFAFYDANRADASIRNGDIARICTMPRAIDNEPVSNNEIVLGHAQRYSGKSRIVLTARDTRVPVLRAVARCYSFVVAELRAGTPKVAAATGREAMVSEIGV